MLEDGVHNHRVDCSKKERKDKKGEKALKTTAKSSRRNAYYKQKCTYRGTCTISILLKNKERSENSPGIIRYNFLNEQ